MISSGLDGTVKLFDLRHLKTKKSAQSAVATPAVAEFNGVRSINSAFFSPSGQCVVTTTQNNKLDVLKDFHLESSKGKNKTNDTVKAWKSISHDNHTGRWLSTFMARFHPSLDIFCVGSMKQPRRLEIFSPTDGLLRGVQGEALTAVASRCCFHPSTDQLIVVCGNSSGRVTIVR
jgi:WD40 repeat protein